MSWGSVGLEPQVRDWLAALSRAARGHAAFYVDLLAELSLLLSEPHANQLDVGLRGSGSIWVAARRGMT